MDSKGQEEEEDSQIVSNYYSLESFLQKNGKINNCFSCLSINIRSLVNKFTDLEELITELNSDNFKLSLIALQEIWNIPENYSLKIENYKPLNFRSRDPTGQDMNCGGGIGIFIHEKYHYEPIPQISLFQARFFESQFLKVYISEYKYIIVGNLYRPPLSDIKMFIDKLEELLNLISSDPNLKQNDDIILLGDFNIDLIKYSSNLETSRYLDLLNSIGLTSCISLPTRIAKNSATLIDHIFLKKTDSYLNSGILQYAISNHLPTFLLKKITELPKNQMQKVYFRDMSQKNSSKAKEEICKLDWAELMQENRPEVAFKKYYAIMNKLLNESFPLKLSNTNARPTGTFEKPWMTAELFTLRKRKHKLILKKTKYPTGENIEEFKRLNNEYNAQKRRAKNIFYKDRLAQYSQNAKKTWDTLREILAETKKANTIPSYFWEGDNKIVGDKNIAKGFANFFANIGESLAKKIPDSVSNFDKYLGPSAVENFNFKSISENDLLDVAKSLRPKSSFGADLLSTKFLKEILPNIAKPICHLFNLSLHTGYIPPEFKTAKVIPIFKSESKHMYNNYRPISLLSSLSKLLEKIVAKQMMGYINKNKIFTDLQFGFRKGHNTIQPVIHFLDKIQEALNKDIPEYTAAVFLDLKKAFDTANHRILLKKMEHYGFRGVSLKWFSNYLSNRKIFVTLNGEDSSPKPLSIGVPQGSVLGPLLFLLLINDLPLAVPALKVLLFADDTTFQLSGKKLTDLYTSLNSELSKALDWFTCNKLTLNISKTKYMLFRNKNMPLDHSLSLKIGLETLERYGEDCKTKSFKFVGHHLDEFLNWKYHISVVRRKVATANFKLNQCKNLLSLKPRKMLYNSLIKPHLEYGLVNWGGAAKGLLKGVTILQKKCIRNICNEKKYAPTNNLLYKLELLKVEDLFKLHCSIFMYKQYYSLHGTSSFDNIFTKLMSSRSKQFSVKLLKKKDLEKFPSCYLVKIWNELDIEIKNSQTTKSFKRLLASLYIDSYFY